MQTADETLLHSEELLEMTIRDLVDRYPVVMPLLADVGLDLCCGGGHALGVALELHGIEAAPLLARIEALLKQSAKTE